MSTFLWSLPASAPAPTPAEQELPSGMVDHVATAIARLPQQFRDDPAVVALLTVFAQRYQNLEVAFWDLLTQRGIYTAFGAQLDVIGRIVGFARGALSDATYQLYLAAQITANHSDGLGEDLIKIARLIVNNAAATIYVTNEGAATTRVRVGGIALPDATATVVATMLDEARAGGVRLLTQYAVSAPANVFAFDSGPGLDVGHLANALEGV